MTTPRLSILDQSPIPSDCTAVDALQATLELAQAADRLGYHRYWLAEHHGLLALADPCPEILLTRVASVTQRIRVGTGGIMLPYYSPLKIAEQFRMLCALFPGRIDLGVGRAPGGDRLTAQAMSNGQYDSAEQFPQQIYEVVGYLDGCLPEDHPFARVHVQPKGDSSPEVWILGSSDYGGALAAHLGLRFTFAHFINAQGGEIATRAYREQFKPSAREPRPYSMVAVFVICAESDAEAEAVASSIDLRRLQMDYGLNTPIPTRQEALNREYSEQELQRIRSHRARSVIGTPDKVKARLIEIKEQFAADEIMVITVTGDYASRLRSYELLAANWPMETAPSLLGAAS
ncbi:MAG: LLM class flavin-dependent oxidoreductase [Burkholderiales bacterium]